MKLRSFEGLVWSSMLSDSRLRWGKHTVLINEVLVQFDFVAEALLRDQFRKNEVDDQGCLLLIMCTFEVKSHSIFFIGIELFEGREHVCSTINMDMEVPGVRIKVYG